ncbi:hypothetical protein AgCh_016656 [Apium graveolens]
MERLASMLLPQLRVDPHRSMDLFLPEERVPEWFTRKNAGARLSLDLPQPWSFRKFKRFATCAVFTPLNPNGSKGTLIEISYSLQSLNDVCLCGTGVETEFFPNETRCYESDQVFFFLLMESDQVWLSYIVPTLDWEKRWEMAKDSIEVEFEIWGICCDRKECVVRLVYDEDEVESSSRITEWLPHSDENNDKSSSVVHIVRKDKDTEAV